MLIINALILHTFLLGSIFVIYFRSPVISGLQPQSNFSNKPLASRLVLIVTDGLRASSFFNNECKDVPNIKKLILQGGVLGISHTRVPTESRPGHIALIAGLYEDPSAVTRGWKENPIDFDTVFNRSRQTFAWGAHDVLSIFTKITTDGRMLIDSYDHDLDFSGQVKTYMLDTWVFDRVKLLLDRKRNELQNELNTIFFLHLLGLDSAGHIHKPGTHLFIENLNITEKGIYDIYEYIEKIFPDNKTAYLLTSDHGMTNTGSHGSGDTFETETPIFLWGSGVNNWNSNSKMKTKKSIKIDDKLIPLIEIEQAQIAPLMSTLVGLPPPMNNFGILPIEFLNASKQYVSEAAFKNSLQLLEQYNQLLLQFDMGIFSSYLPSFKNLTQTDILIFRKDTEKRLNNEEFDIVLANCFGMMATTLNGIEYYQAYYKNILLFSTTMAFIGWIIYLILLLVDESSTKIKNGSSLFLILGVVLVLIGILFLQRVPFVVSIYIVAPILLWVIPFQNVKTHLTLLKQLKFQYLVNFILVIAGCEIIVASFFSRSFVSLALVILGVFESFNIFKKKLHVLGWILFTLLLAIFPQLPGVNGQKNDLLLLCGVILAFGKLFLSKIHLNIQIKLITFSALLNGAFCIFLHNNLQTIPNVNFICSWFSMFALFILPLISINFPKELRVQTIFHCLTITYILLCTSYEPIFLILLGTHVSLFTRSTQQKDVLDQLHTKDNSFLTAFAILVYIFFSFFGTGNIASVSSFDPNVIRCFLSRFSPFIIMSLVILKLIIPVVLINCLFFGLSSYIDSKRVFICMLIICDIMGLNFLFLVKNTGSWLDIGSSISHFVIMEATTLILVLISYLAKFLVNYKLPFVFGFKIKQ